jgi:hypothetical protein
VKHSPIVALSDAQMSALLAASYPLPADCRDDFLLDCARELAQLPELGDGVMHRIVTVVQARYFVPPPPGRLGLTNDHRRSVA